MDEIILYETAHKILLRQLKNKNYPMYLANIFKTSEELSSVKSSLKELNTVLRWNDSIKEFLMDKSIFYQHLANEIYAYYHKAYTQKKNISLMTQEKDYDFTWLYVTQYYQFFFTSCALSRMNNYFVIYLEDDIADEISTVASLYYGEKIKINGSGSFFLKAEKYKEDDNKLKITLTTAGNQHRCTLQSLKNFIKNYNTNAVASDIGLEFRITEKIYNLFRKEDFSFSSSRNYYNYRFETAYQNTNLKLISNNHYNNKDLMWEYLINMEIQSINILNSSDSLVCISEYLYQMLSLSIESMLDH